VKDRLDVSQISRFIRRARRMPQDEERLTRGEIDELAAEIKEQRVEEMAEAFTRAMQRIANKWVLKFGWTVAGLAAIGLLVVLLAVGAGHQLKRFFE
jgi:uncharacterized hydantoinase/oxoprolinase family protein